MSTHPEKILFRLWNYALLVSLIFVCRSNAATASPLFSRGYTVLPEPQKVTLGARDFQFGPDWRLELGISVPPNDVAVESLKDGLASRFGVTLSSLSGARAGTRTLRLTIAPAFAPLPFSAS
jgi:hypothetical protein